ncbi:MAG: TolC family protein, partial [Verrucomicrobiales bacterium]
CQHPATRAAANRVLAAESDICSVRLWDDPTVGLGLMAARQMMRRDDGDVIWSIEQTLPKRGLYQAILEKSGAQKRAEVENARSAQIDSGVEATTLAIELALADAVMSLSSGELSWLREMETNALKLALDPASTSIDAIRLGAEVRKAEQNLAAVGRNRSGLAQQLNLVMGKPLDHPWEKLRLPVSSPSVPIAASEVARIPFANPEVRALLEKANAAKAEICIADRERLPAVSVGLDTALYSGGDWRSTTFGVKMSLPWRNRDSYQAKVDATTSRSAAASEDVETLTRQIGEKVIEAVTEAANASAQSRAYGGEIRQKAIDANKYLETSWISSKASLTDLLESRRLLFSVDLEQRRFVAMALAAIERLNRLVPTHPPN